MINDWGCSCTHQVEVYWKGDCSVRACSWRQEVLRPLNFLFFLGSTQSTQRPLQSGTRHSITIRHTISIPPTICSPQATSIHPISIHFIQTSPTHTHTEVYARGICIATMHIFFTSKHILWRPVEPHHNKRSRRAQSTRSTHINIRRSPIG